jgi:hypothetical protein
MKNNCDLKEAYDYIEKISISHINFYEISLMFQNIVYAIGDKNLEDVKTATYEADIFSNKIIDGNLNPDSSSYYYTTSTPMSEGAWTQRYFMSMLGGPVTKSVYCKAVSKNKGTYASRQYAGLTLVGGSNQYVYTTIK